MDVEKTIQFMIEQQARFDTQLSRLVDVQIGLTETQSRQQGMIGQLTDVVGQLAQVQKHTNHELEELRRRTEEADRRLDEKLEQLTGNVNALIKMMDEWIRGDGRGPARPQ